MWSNHWKMDRAERLEVIREIGWGHIFTAKITVDKDGIPVIMYLTDNAIVAIQNRKTRKVVTVLIARPKQIKKMFGDRERIPKWLLETAQYHKEKGYCNK